MQIRNGQKHKSKLKKKTPKPFHSILNCCKIKIDFDPKFVILYHFLKDANARTEPNISISIRFQINTKYTLYFLFKHKHVHKRTKTQKISLEKANRCES